MVRHRLVFAAMILVPGAVLEEHAMQLLDVIFSGSDGLVSLENHVDRVGIARHFLFVTA
jgi:hypothetical protein